VLKHVKAYKRLLKCNLGDYRLIADGEALLASDEYYEQDTDEWMSVPDLYVGKVWKLGWTPCRRLR
jgi:hypothetical protein